LPAEQLLTNPATFNASSTFKAVGNWPEIGETISLYNSSGGLLATAVTNTSGNVSFSGLAAGSYQLGFTPPSGTTLSSGPINLNLTTGLTSLISVAAGTTATEATVYVVATPAAILVGSVVYQNSAGTTAALANETVTLFDASSDRLVSVVTNSGGGYEFWGLAAGSYQLFYTLPSGETYAAGGPANTTTGLTGLIAVAAGTEVTEATETLVAALANLGGSVTYAGAADAGVTVALLSSTGTQLSTTTTNSAGVYQFANIVVGTYEIKFTAPANTLFGTGPANTGTGITAPVTLTAGQTTTLAPENLLPTTATLAGTVLSSASGTGGVGLSGVSVALLNASGTIVATTSTNSSGAFQFAGLAVGSYSVKYTAPSGTVLELGGTANASTGLSAQVTLTAGQTTTLPAEQLLTNPATFNASSTFKAVGNWPEIGETISLYNSSGGLLATAVTNTSGNVSFSGLAAGSYQLGFTPPSGMTLSSGPINLNVTTGLTSLISVAAGTTATEATVYIVASPAAILAGSVFYQNPAGTTAALANATVTLFDASSDRLVSVVTNSGGGYEFWGLAAGSYQLLYSLPAGDTYGAGGPANTTTGLTGLIAVAAGANVAEAKETLVAALANLGGSVTYAGAADAGVTVALLSSTGTQLATTTTNSAGAYQFANIVAGTYEIAFTAPANTIFSSGPANTTSGITGLVTLTPGQTTTLAAENLLPAPATITGSVASSASGAGGVALAGVNVALLNASGTTVATASSNSSGAFQFTGLAAGSYTVKYTAPSGSVLELGSTANTSTGLSAPITLTAGQTTALATEQLLTNPATINTSAIFKAVGNWPEIGQTISLYNSSGGLVGSAVTNNSGVVTFSGVAAGSYQLGYTAPSGMVLDVGPNSMNLTTGLTSLFNVHAGVTITETSEYVSASPAATIAGSIFYKNSAGVSSYLANATVTLLNASGGVLTSVVTNAGGGYQFWGLAAGTYELSYTLPSGDSFATGPANATTGITSPITLGAGQSVGMAAETLQAAGVVAQVAVAQVAAVQTQALAASSISGVVVDAAAGQTGVAVLLLNASGATISQTTTNGAGFFSIGGLSSGTYEVEYAAAPSSLASGSWTDQLQPITLGVNQATTVAANQFAVSSSTSFVLNGAGQQLVGGSGNYTVSGSASGSSILLGAGDQTVSLTGGADTIVVGDGGSTISALGGGNMIRAGAGMNFITTDGSSGNVFYVDGAGQGTTTINGFNTVGDVLDLTSALSGLAIAADLSNLGTYVTASVAAGNTTLWIDPTGGSATPAAFVVLNGISATLPQLVAAHDISMV
jgi:hypothetical protein